MEYSDNIDVIIFMVVICCVIISYICYCVINHMRMRNRVRVRNRVGTDVTDISDVTDDLSEINIYSGNPEIV